MLQAGDQDRVRTSVKRAAVTPAITTFEANARSTSTATIITAAALPAPDPWRRRVFCVFSLTDRPASRTNWQPLCSGQ